MARMALKEVIPAYDLRMNGAIPAYVDRGIAANDSQYPRYINPRVREPGEFYPKLPAQQKKVPSARWAGAVRA